MTRKNGDDDGDEPGENEKDDESESREFVNCRFTLTEEIDGKLDDLADDRHSGNRSAFIRALVNAEDQRDDEDNLSPGQRRIKKAIDDLNDQIESHSEDDPSQPPPGQEKPEMPSQDPQTPMGSGDSEKSESVAQIAHEIYHIFRDEDREILALGGLVAQVDATLTSTAEAIEQLTQKGAVEPVVSENCQKYRLKET